MKEDRQIGNNYTSCFLVETSAHKEALIAVFEVVGENAFHFISFLFDDKFGEIIIRGSGQQHVCSSVPGTGNGL